MRVHFIAGSAGWPHMPCASQRRTGTVRKSWSWRTKLTRRVTNVEQANQVAQCYIAQAEFDKGVGYAATAQKAGTALSKNPSSAYSATELLIARQRTRTSCSQSRSGHLCKGNELRNHGYRLINMG
jgi:hypothetical protein